MREGERDTDRERERDGSDVTTVDITPIHACIQVYGAAVGTLHTLTITPGSSTDNVAVVALTPSIACSSRRQDDKLSNAGSFVFLRRTEAELLCLGASPCRLGASPCRPCTASLMVDFIAMSSLLGVLLVLLVGLALLSVFPFSFGRLESCGHPSPSTKGDSWTHRASGVRLLPGFR